MKDKLFQWWNDWMNGVIVEYSLTRTKVFKFILAVVLSIFAVFLVGRCSAVKAHDKPPPEKPPEVIVKTVDRVECDHKCKRKQYIKGIGLGALTIGGIWYFNQKGAEKKPVEIGVEMRNQ